MKGLRQVIPCALLLLCSTAGAFAQGVTEQLRVAQRQNWYLRVAGDDITFATGRVRSVGSDQAVVAGITIDVSRIAAVERRVDVGGGFLGGALVGATGGVFFGAGLAGLCDNNCPRNAALTGALIFGGIGALMGGVAGQLVVPPKHRWQRVWPRT